MNRRTLLQGLAATAAGLLLPPTLAENAEAARRYWALDQTMMGGAEGFLDYDMLAHVLGNLFEQSTITDDALLNAPSFREWQPGDPPQWEIVSGDPNEPGSNVVLRPINQEFFAIKGAHEMTDVLRGWDV